MFGCCKVLGTVVEATKKEDKATASGADAAGDGGDGQGAGAGAGGSGGDGGGGGGGGGDDRLRRGRKRKPQSLYWVLVQVNNLEECHLLIRRVAMEIIGVDAVTIDVPNSQVTIAGPMATDPDSLVAILRTRSNLAIDIVSAPFRGYTPSSSV
ncbi:hypothetical protein GUJ93_ZPchr0012g20352 [Zizania palustris]|uniref:HMA domain-containing protein n=1 Tax=Zizania palustris TaxID=103762 RepID=A0A8J5WIA0_ZIZPA|nr:hypothetical protein GUJ93_ZPchr0012g20352 [Zizania palustris]